VFWWTGETVAFVQPESVVGWGFSCGWVHVWVGVKCVGVVCLFRFVWFLGLLWFFFFGGGHTLNLMFGFCGFDFFIKSCFVGLSLVMV